MRLIFMGSPAFAVPSLEALAEAGHDIACVHTQPPRPAGRGQKARPCPVQAWAEEHGLPVRTPPTLRDPAAQADFAALGAEVAVVAAYGLILPRAVLAAPERGCLNVHASLLPRWRGAAPIQCAILAGDAETGVSIMRMEEGLDTGPVLLAERLSIAADATALDLYDALARIGARLIVTALARLDELREVQQPDEGVTYAAKIGKEEARIDWRLPAAEIERRVRAFNPWPGAWCRLGGRRLKVLTARVAAGAGTPGRTLDDGLTVACGADALGLVVVQPEGRPAMDAASFLRGHPVAAGTLLG